MVFVARDGECRVIATGTADAQRALNGRPDDFVGTYNVCGADATYSKRERDQIAGDIWHHLRERANQLEAA